MSQPLPMFTVICLCHNQARFVVQALDSVGSQQYEEGVQLIIVDDASTDGSQERIKGWVERTAFSGQTIFIEDNLGNCRAFNQALAMAEGEFIIDLAADDQLAPDRLSSHAKAFLENPKAAMVYGDAWYVDANARQLYRHSDQVGQQPEGDVFARLFQGNFICPSTVSFRTESLKQLGGYDEQLSFEDFDAWMRLARVGKVQYVPEIASLHRVSAGSLSGRFYKANNPEMAQSIVRIGEKALGLARDQAEKDAIAAWLRFQARLAAYMGYDFALEELSLLHKNAVGKGLPGYWLWKMVAGMQIGWLYRIYVRVRY